jgi:hypothetical protein
VVAARSGGPQLASRGDEGGHFDTSELALITKASRGHHGEERADAWRAVAESALELYDHDPAVPFEDLAAEVATETRPIRTLLAERDDHDPPAGGRLPGRRLRRARPHAARRVAASAAR